jgi:hypothetical protein
VLRGQLVKARDFAVRSAGGRLLAALGVNQILVVPFYKTGQAYGLSSFLADWQDVISAVITAAVNDINPYYLFSDALLFKPMSRSLSLLAAFFRLSWVAPMAANSLNYFTTLVLLGGAHYLTTFEPLTKWGGGRRRAVGGAGPATLRSVLDTLEAPRTPCTGRDHSRAHDTQAPALGEILRLRTGPVA